ncbi:MAG: prepilin-type N-terminal cleavage/methylation domain-containing protein [Steroidobacteraceae bacterium]
MRTARGFTLVELVLTIAISAIVLAFMAMFILAPMNAYSSQARRADLVDAADGALRLVARDLRLAVPNSVRIGGAGSIAAIELLASVDGARYRDGGPLTDPSRELDFSAADGAFATTVPFANLALPFSSTSHYLVIYNVGVPGADAWAAADVITPAGTRIDITAGATANENLVTLSPAFRFAWGSPGKRVYLASGPVTYLCDSSAGTLVRYSGYTPAPTQPGHGGGPARGRRERRARRIRRRLLLLQLHRRHGETPRSQRLALQLAQRAERAAAAPVLVNAP